MRSQKGSRTSERLKRLKKWRKLGKSRKLGEETRLERELRGMIVRKPGSADVRAEITQRLATRTHLDPKRPKMHPKTQKRKETFEKRDIRGKCKFST